MENHSPLPASARSALLAFAAAAVASIALQNLVWVAVAIFLFHQFRNRMKPDWPKGLFPLATLLFLATFFLGALAGVDPANSFHTVHKYLTFLLLFPLGAMSLQEADLRKLLTAFVYGASFCALYGIGKHFILHQDRIDSFSGDKMVFGGMLMAALLLALVLLKESPRSPLLWISLPLMGTALVLTQTRGAWVGFVAGFFLLAWRSSRKGLLAGILGLLVLFLLLPKPLQERVTSIGELDLSYDTQGHIQNSSQTRVLIWISGWRMAQDHPWGVGQGNVEKVYPQYRFPEQGLELNIPHLHDNFLQLLAQNGWMGLAAYLFWIFAYYRTALKRGPKEGVGRDWNWAFLCVFSSVLVWGFTEYTFSHQFMNIQFFLLGLQAVLWKGSSGNSSRAKNS